jgi:DNA adenine methylase
VRPFVRWAGGKTQLLPAILQLLQEAGQFEQYHEPFLGGGAVWLAFDPPAHRSHLGDLNVGLMALWTEVALRPALLCAKITDLGPDGERQYYDHRDRFNDHPAKRRGASECGAQATEFAALFYWLNRTCFNGLYRESAAGKFNTPWGRLRLKERPVLDDRALWAAYRRARGTTVDWRDIPVEDGLGYAHLYRRDFRAALGAVGRGCLAYVDSPYPKVKGGAFDAYAAGGFSEEDHRDLAAGLRACSDRGAKFLASNADVPLVRDLYAGFDIIQVRARRSINRDGAGRGAVGEVLIRNYRKAE